MKKRNHKLPTFVVQEHAGRTHHYHLHLVEDGKVRSWDFLYGPSVDPKKKCLARRDDMPLGLALFEGVLPLDRYESGTLLVWDIGTYRTVSHASLKDAVKSGVFKVRLKGKKLRGDFVFIQLAASGGKEWLVVKVEDYYDRTFDILKKRNSVLTGRTIERIAKEERGPLSPIPKPR